MSRQYLSIAQFFAEKLAPPGARRGELDQHIHRGVIELAKDPATGNNALTAEQAIAAALLLRLAGEKRRKDMKSLAGIAAVVTNKYVEMARDGELDASKDDQWVVLIPDGFEKSGRSIAFARNAQEAAAGVASLLKSGCDDFRVVEVGETIGRVIEGWHRIFYPESHAATEISPEVALQNFLALHKSVFEGFTRDPAKLAHMRAQVAERGAASFAENFVSVDDPAEFREPALRGITDLLRRFFGDQDTIDRAPAHAYGEALPAVMVAWLKTERDAFAARPPEARLRLVNLIREHGHDALAMDFVSQLFTKDPRAQPFRDESTEQALIRAFSQMLREEFGPFEPIKDGFELQAIGFEEGEPGLIPPPRKRTKDELEQGDD